MSQIQVWPRVSEIVWMQMIFDWKEDVCSTEGAGTETSAAGAGYDTGEWLCVNAGAEAEGVVSGH